MITKIYKLNKPMNSSNFRLPANDGKMEVEYQFKDGNQLMRQPARCTLRNEFYQNLLENSELFKNGVVSLERTINDKKEEPKPATTQKTIVESVTSPDMAIEYVANTFGIVTKSGKQAVKIAGQKGVEFPNLKETK